MVKKLILLGFALALLVGLPLAIFVVQQNQSTNTKSSAAQATKFTFDTSALTTINVGQNFGVPIDVDPQGQNQVSFVKVTFTYDGTKLGTDSTTPVTIANAKSGASYTKLEGPTVSCTDANVCTGTFTISIGGNPQDVITAKTAVATINFTAKAATDPQTPTKLDFVSGQNQALSVASSDQPAENVFLGGIPASLTIGAQASTTQTPTPSTTTPAPTGTTGGGGPTTGGGGPTGGNSSVSCSSLTADPTSGQAPLSVTFTAVGASGNDSISNLVINYGDGNVDQVASGSGIGTGNVNAQTTHSYSQNGTFTATATFTTSTGATNPSGDCKQTITVGTSQPLQTLKTGPGDSLLGIGIGGAVLTVIGVGLLFGL